MSMDNSVFGGIELKSAKILIVFDNVLKSPDFGILRRILRDYHDTFIEYLKLELIDTLSPEALLPFVMHRTKENCLEWLAKEKFNYYLNRKDLYERFKDMYILSPELRMYSAMMNFAYSYCVDKIYVWNEERDIRQQYDLSRFALNHDKITYVTGYMQNVIDATNVNIVYDWDIERVKKLTDGGMNADICFILAKYPFNMEEDGITLKYDLSEHGNVVTFEPYIFERNSLFLG